MCGSAHQGTPPHRPRRESDDDEDDQKKEASAGTLSGDQFSFSSGLLSLEKNSVYGPSKFTFRIFYTYAYYIYRTHPNSAN